MSPWEGLNRRKFPRVNFPCLVKVSLNPQEQDVILTHTENIGVGGIGVTFKHSFKLFTPMDLEIDLLDGNDHIRCKGKVVWSIRRKADESVKPYFYDVGIEFLSLDSKDHKRIDAAIEQLAKKSGARASR